MKLSDYATPDELKRLVGVFLSIVAAIALAAVFLFTVVPGLRNANKPPAGPDIPTLGATGWLDPTDYPASRGYDLPPVDPKTVLAPTPELQALGRSLFESRCASCHGPAGKGDGPSSATLDPKPRDLTKPQDWKNGSTLSGIFKTVSDGLSGSQMAAFDYIPSKDRMALVHHVRSLASFPLPPDDPASLAGLSKLFASSGHRVPNKIPVSLAIRLLEKDYEEPPPLDLSPRARGIILDPPRAGRWLASSAAWRKSPSALSLAAAAGSPANGFSPSAAALPPSAWAALHSELLRQRGLKHRPRRP